ncbi:MAG: LysR family transcriptional regulator [Erysipelotrichaceae bacterium]|nr:LysR family transcriptional regulator [Erysipelotrichaceae bacterium]
MNIHQLEYFIAVAENKSFTKAGSQFFISQTAITQQIKQLEEELGCQLIDRSTRPLSLTIAGKTFLKESKSIINQLGIAINKTKESVNVAEGALKIGFLKGFERSDFSNTLAKFHHLYPNTIITLYRMSSDELSQELKNGNLDAIITWDNENFYKQDNFYSRVFNKIPLIVAMYKNHPLAKKDKLTRFDLQNENLIYMSRTSNNDQFAESYYLNIYYESGICPNILFSSSDFESILMMVASEQGISVMPEYCTNKLSNADNLVFRPLTGEKEFEIVSFVYRKDNPNIELINKLDEMI